jgi:hypothetical protein
MDSFEIVYLIDAPIMSEDNVEITEDDLNIVPHSRTFLGHPITIRYRYEFLGSSVRVGYIKLEKMGLSISVAAILTLSNYTHQASSYRYW